MTTARTPRMVALAAALALPLALLSATPASAATVGVATWTDLKAAFLIDGDTVRLDADITAVANEPLVIQAAENITLDLNGYGLTITDPGAANAAISVPATSSLIISDTSGGTLTATGGFFGAGIGGGLGIGGGTVTITGGTVTAGSGEGGAGIGGGFNGDGATLTVTGGTVIANGGNGGSGGYNAAGIGGGNAGDGGTTTINGGTVTATGGNKAAGIGGGDDGGSGGITTINGGTTTATGGNNAAGIGSGFNGGTGVTGGTTTINGGILIATGGFNGAGIGGSDGHAGGTTIINGGTITATGGSDAAGIGGGDGGSAGVLQVNGTLTGGGATDGGAPVASPITNPTTPAGVGYSATTSTVSGGGRIVLRFNYLVTFAANGGTSTANRIIDDGDPLLTAPATPTREGFVFAGWTSAGSAYDFTTPVTAPLTLSATWTALLAATGTEITTTLGIATLLMAGGAMLIALRRRVTPRSA